MPLTAKFWGTRGSIPTPGPHTRRYGGNTSCVEVSDGATTLICDAGSGIRGLGAAILRRPVPAKVHLLFSHAHWDHIQGFPFFGPAYLPTSEIHIYDVGSTGPRFHSLLSGQMQSEYFPIRFSDLKANLISERIDNNERVIGDIRIRAFTGLRHPGGCIAYSFESGDAKVVYATDNEIDQMFAGPPPVSGPRPVDPTFVQFIRGADLLISDAQYSDAEYATNKAGWGHSSMGAAVDLAIQANVGRLGLFHHDPQRTDAQIEELSRAASARAANMGSRLIVFPTRESVELSEGSWGARYASDAS